MESYFKDIENKPIKVATEVQGGGVFNDVGSLQVGMGTQVLRMDQSGLWLGANKFADAPYSVDMAGNVIASSATFSAYATTAAALLKAGTSQALTGDFNLNDANVKIDGANKRILINDGTNDRIIVGYSAGGF